MCNFLVSGPVRNRAGAGSGVSGFQIGGSGTGAGPGSILCVISGVFSGAPRGLPGPGFPRGFRVGFGLGFGSNFNRLMGINRLPIALPRIVL